MARPRTVYIYIYIYSCLTQPAFAREQIYKSSRARGDTYVRCNYSVARHINLRQSWTLLISHHLHTLWSYFGRLIFYPRCRRARGGSCFFVVVYYYLSRVHVCVRSCYMNVNAFLFQAAAAATAAIWRWTIITSVCPPTAAICLSIRLSICVQPRCVAIVRRGLLITRA